MKITPAFLRAGVIFTAVRLGFLVPQSFQYFFRHAERFSFGLQRFLADGTLSRLDRPIAEPGCPYLYRPSFFTSVINMEFHIIQPREPPNLFVRSSQSIRKIHPKAIPQFLHSAASGILNL